MKNFCNFFSKPFLWVCSLFLLFASVSCTSNDEIDIYSKREISKVSCKVKEFLYEEHYAFKTRLSLTYDPLGMKFNWSQNDAIGVYPKEGEQMRYKLTNISDDGHYADILFDGGGWAMRPELTYSAYYPYSIDNTTNDIPYTNIPLNYEGQKQSSNNSTEHLSKYCFMYSTAKTSADNGILFDFEHISCVVRVEIKVLKSDTYSKLTLSIDEPLFATKATVDISTGEMTPTELSNSIIIDLDDIKADKDEKLIVYFMCPPTNLSEKTITATLSTNSGEKYHTEFTGKNMTSGHAYKFSGDIADTTPVIVIGLGTYNENSGVRLISAATNRARVVMKTNDSKHPFTYFGKLRPRYGYNTYFETVDDIYTFMYIPKDAKKVTCYFDDKQNRNLDFGLNLFTESSIRLYDTGWLSYVPSYSLDLTKFRQGDKDLWFLVSYKTTDDSEFAEKFQEAGDPYEFCGLRIVYSY